MKAQAGGTAMVSRIFGLAAVAAAAALSACAVNVPENAFFWPESRLEREKIVLAANPPPDAAESLSLPYEGGTIAATRIRSAAAPRPLILFCGGNMFRRSSAGGSAARKLEPFGDVLMFDYPAYGETDGEADFAHFAAAGAVMAATARAQADAEGRPLIAWGHSLGGVVCTDAAVKARADVLVLETTTPGARAAVNQQAGLMRPFVRLNLAPALASIDVPAALEGYAGRIIVIEAGRDETLAPALSQALARQLRQRGLRVEHLVFPNAGHNDVGRQPDFEARMTTALAR